MAFGSGRLGVVYVNGYDLSSYLKDFKFGGKVQHLKTTTLGKTSETFIPGLKDATLTANGFFDPGANAENAVFVAALGAAISIWTYLPLGDGFGNNAYGFDAILTGYDVNSPVDNVASIVANAQSKVGMEPVKVLHPLGLDNGSVNGTVYDYGGASSGGGASYLQLTAATGTTNSMTLRVAHSVDNVTFVDLLSHTVITNQLTPSAERYAVTGTVNRYIRSAANIGGSGSPSFTYHHAFVQL